MPADTNHGPANPLGPADDHGPADGHQLHPGGSVKAPFLPASEWTVGDVVLALLAGIVGAVIGGIVIRAGASGTIETGDISVTIAAQAFATLAFVAWIGRNRGTGVWWRDVGVQIRPRYLWGIFTGVALQVAVALIVGPLVRLLAPDAPRQEIVDVAERTSGAASRLVFAVLVVLVVPFVEEVVFRGMLLSRLRRTMGPVAAVALSAAAFAALHLIDPNALAAVPGLFLIGAALGWMTLRSGDIGRAIFVHAGVNLTGVLVVFLAPETLEAPTTALALSGF